MCRGIRDFSFEKSEPSLVSVVRGASRGWLDFALSFCGFDTDYTTSPTARSFVPFYSQRLSAACVLNGARAIQKSLKRKADRRRLAATAA